MIIKCKICHSKCKSYMSLSTHIRKLHNISPKCYYDRYFRNYSIDKGFCLNCGKETKFKNINIGYLNFCCNKCATQGKFNGMYCKPSPLKNTKRSKEIIKKIIDSRKGYKHSFETRQKMSKAKLGKRKTNINGIPKYDYWNDKINIIDETRKTEEGYIEVKCKKCSKWFIPTLISIRNRYYCIIGKYNGEQNFYCSDECKSLCSIYYKYLYQQGQNQNIDRPYQTEWSEEIKKNAGYECEICGSIDNLVAHHIEPVKLRPDLQADIDNGICLCRNCHIEYGHKDECSTGNLAKLIC